jgi:WD40 repeat protein
MNIGGPDMTFDHHSTGRPSALRKAVQAALLSLALVTVTSNGAVAAPATETRPRAASGPPGAPPRLLAIASDSSVRLAWSRPDDGGSPITGYEIHASDGTVFRVSPYEDPAVLTGLRNGVTYQFTVQAQNADGTGPASAPSNPVVPSPPSHPGRWAATASMPTARSGHAAVQLKTGKVLVVGGDDGNHELSRADLYDPTTHTWSRTGSMRLRRSFFTAIVLRTGKVLATGGYSPSTHEPTASAELYDPTTGRWSRIRPMRVARDGHTLALRADGKVLAAGGVTTRRGNWIGTRSAEVYNPATGRWTRTRPMRQMRFAASAVLLRGGKILVVGGGAGSRSAELYDPRTGRWTRTGSTRRVHEYADGFGNKLVRLASGDVLVAGGYDDSTGDVLTSAEVYSVATGRWTLTGDMGVARERHTLTRLPGGEVLVTGGADDYGPLSPAEVYDPVRRTWARATDLNLPRTSHSATLLPDGTVLIAGGDLSMEEAVLFRPTL